MTNFEYKIRDLFGSREKNNVELTEHSLDVMVQLIKKPIVILSKTDLKASYMNESFKSIFFDFDLENSIELIGNLINDDYDGDFEHFFAHEGHRAMFSFDCKSIKYLNQESVFVIADKIGVEQTEKSVEEKIISLSKGILNINNTVDISDDVSKTLNLVLNEALKVFKKGDFGSIFITQNDTFKIMAQSGFSSDINNFRLPIRDSFLYVETQGKMDRIVLIDNIREKFTVIPTRTSSGELAEILTSIVAPIYFRGSLYGMMSIDSESVDAFSIEDLEVMTFIRDNVQAIISNQLLFLERTQQALTDPMTGLYNRLYFNEYLETLIERSKRYSEKFCLVVLDIDNLKTINDQFGHLAGDHIIKSFASDLQKSVRRSDVLARFGGDEFVAVYLNAGEEEIRKKLESLKRQTVYPIGDNESIELDYSFSYGISTFPKDGSSYSVLINSADARMYQIKTENKVKSFHIE